MRLCAVIFPFQIEFWLFIRSSGFSPNTLQSEMSTTRNNRRSPSEEIEGGAQQAVMQIETRKRKRRNSGNSDELFTDYGLTPTESWHCFESID